MDRQRRERIAKNELSEIRTYRLGGYDQKVLLEGRRRDLPIVLFLHGGPGSPVPFCVGCRGMFPRLTDRVVMVCWDQYGCGINDAAIDDSFSIADYVSMTVDLVLALKRDFPGQAINLFGVSWGSVLAAKTAERIPEELSHVVTYGQVRSDLVFNGAVYMPWNAPACPCEKNVCLRRSNPKRRTMIPISNGS